MSDHARPGVSVPPPVTAAQRSVLYAVRRRGEATVDDVAEMLDMTPSRRPPAPHRPRRRRAARGRRGARAAGQRAAAERTYCITPAAEPLFPRAYGELTNQLLGYLPAGGGRRGVRAPARRPHRRRPRPGWPPGAASPPRSPSWPASSTRTATWPSVEPIDDRDASASPSATAPSSPSPASTPRPARARSSSSAPPCPRPTIERVTHMMAGAHSCSYEIRKKRAA